MCECCEGETARTFGVKSRLRSCGPVRDNKKI